MGHRLVSVIMSVYDGDSSDFLIESLESIINQSYKNFEIILIGDGLTNKNLIDVINQLELQHKEFLKYFPQKENQGLACCMNKAIQIANGDFFARFDADDIMVFNRLEKQTEFLNNNLDIDIVGSWILEFDGEINRERLIKFPVNHDDMLRSFGKRNPVAHPSVMMRRRFFDKAGLYPVDTLTDEDTVLWTNGFIANCQYANIDHPLTKMRVSDIFYHRRSGINKAYKDLVNRIHLVSKLKLSKINYLYAIARFLIQIIPFAKIKRIAYNNLR